jgi:hypothetical protein
MTLYIGTNRRIWLREASCRSSEISNGSPVELSLTDQSYGILQLRSKHYLTRVTAHGYSQNHVSKSILQRVLKQHRGGYVTTYTVGSQCGAHLRVSQCGLASSNVCRWEVSVGRSYEFLNIVSRIEVHLIVS